MGCCASDLNFRSKEKAKRYSVEKICLVKSPQKHNEENPYLSTKAFSAETCESDTVETKSNDFKLLMLTLPAKAVADIQDDSKEQIPVVHLEFVDHDLEFIAERSKCLDDLAHAFSPGEMAMSAEEGGLRIIFDSIDVNGDGVIQPEELAKALSITSCLDPAQASDIKNVEKIMLPFHDPKVSGGWKFHQFRQFMIAQALSQ